MTKPIKIAIALFIITVVALLTALIFFSSRSIENDNQISLTELVPESGLLGRSTEITLTFSKNLPADLDPTSLALEPGARGVFSVDQNMLSFTPAREFVPGDEYILDLQTVIGDDLELVGQQQVEFSVVNVSFNNLTDEIQQQQIADQTPLDEKYPILKFVPRNAPEFQLTYSLNSADFILEEGDTQENAVVLHLNVFAAYSIEVPEKYDFQLRQNKAAAFEYLESNGFNPDDFTIIFSPEEARDI